ncbi:MAG: transcriptional regulator [Gammaproteobacteria bacterium]|nr:MAG: transcriptional regulator [Gammaproteobacteria bacterium]PIE35993.1 MAG: transcriptional regulator [Gammaproteobacteria bacterium]
MASKIDELDRKILRRLQADASPSVEQLAASVKLSRNACWRRIKALEADGIIRRRVALLNAEALSLGLTALVLIRTREHDEEWLSLFREIVRDTPDIVGAYRMSGDLDYLLRVQVGSVADYDRFYQRLIGRISIADISASFVMEELKETTELPV